MILFLRDLYKMENTCVYLIIIKIEPNFRSLFYHESIIKAFCSREQSTSHVHTHTFIELKIKKKQWKLQNCEVLTRFWETFCGVLKGVCFVLFFPLFNFFFTILSACSITGSVATIVGRSMLSCYHGVQGKDAFYLTPRRPFKYSDDGEF